MSSPNYNRELIAQILDDAALSFDMGVGIFNPDSIREQARLLRQTNTAAPGMGDLIDRLNFEAAALIAAKGRVPESSDVSLLREAAAALAAQPAPGVGGELAKHPAIRNLIHFTEHCISASEEGVEYAVTRPWLDAMTTMGLMEKAGRGRWAVTDAAQELIDATRPAESVAQGGEAVPVAVVGIGGYPNWLISWLESPSYVHLPQGTKLYAMPPNAKHWHDLYRKESQLRRDDAARYGEQILVLETATPLPDDHTTSPTRATGSGGEASYPDDTGWAGPGHGKLGQPSPCCPATDGRKPTLYAEVAHTPFKPLRCSHCNKGSWGLHYPDAVTP